ALENGEWIGFGAGITPLSERPNRKQRPKDDQSPKRDHHERAQPHRDSAAPAAQSGEALAPVAVHHPWLHRASHHPAHQQGTDEDDPQKHGKKDRRCSIGSHDFLLRGLSLPRRNLTGPAGRLADPSGWSYGDAMG